MIYQIETDMIPTRFFALLAVGVAAHGQSSDFRVIDRLQNLSTSHYDAELQGFALSDGNSRLIVDNYGEVSVRDVSSTGAILRERTLHFYTTNSVPTQVFQPIQDQTWLINDSADGCSVTKLGARLEIELRVEIPVQSLSCQSSAQLPDGRVAIAHNNAAKFELIAADASSWQSIDVTLPTNAPVGTYSLHHNGQHLIARRRTASGLWIAAFSEAGAFRWQQTLESSNEQLDGLQVHIEANGDLLIVGEFADVSNERKIRYAKINTLGQLVQPLSQGAPGDPYGFDNSSGNVLAYNSDLFVVTWGGISGPGATLLHFRGGKFLGRVAFDRDALIAGVIENRLLIGVNARPGLIIETRSLEDLSLLRSTPIAVFESNDFAFSGGNVFSLSSMPYTNFAGIIVEGSGVIQKLGATGAVEWDMDARYEMDAPGSEFFVRAPNSLVHTRLEDGVNSILRVNSSGERSLIVRSNERALAATAEGQWLVGSSTRFVDNEGIERLSIPGSAVAARPVGQDAWLHMVNRVLKVGPSGEILAQYPAASEQARIEFLNDAGDYLQIPASGPTKRLQADGTLQFERTLDSYTHIAGSDDLLIFAANIERVSPNGQTVWSRAWPFGRSGVVSSQQANNGARLLIFPINFSGISAVWISEASGVTTSTFALPVGFTNVYDPVLQHAPDGLPILQAFDGNRYSALKLDATGVVQDLSPPNFRSDAQFWQDTDGNTVVHYLGLDPEFGGLRWHTATTALLKSGFED
jgi:hypothetical protein